MGTKTELREVGVNKMGHLMKLTKGIAELNGTAASAAMTAEMAPQSQPAYATCSLKGMADVAPSTSMVSAQAVGQSQLIAEAADVIKKADNVPSLNDVLQSAVMANKIAEVIRGESESMPLTLCMLAAKFGRAGCTRDTQHRPGRRRLHCSASCCIRWLCGVRQAAAKCWSGHHRGEPLRRNSVGQCGEARPWIATRCLCTN